MDSIAANVSANLLGLGNAATPLGLEAARRMSRCSPGVASDALCMLVVCNTASIQLIPTTVATVRAGAGSAAPFDILPAVWLASGLSVGVGVLACQDTARGYGGIDMLDLMMTLLVPLTLGLVAVYAACRGGWTFTMPWSREQGRDWAPWPVSSRRLVGLLTAVYMLRASGALDLAAQALAPLLDRVGRPGRDHRLCCWCAPSAGSAALGVGAELIQT